MKRTTLTASLGDRLGHGSDVPVRDRSRRGLLSLRKHTASDAIGTDSLPLGVPSHEVTLGPIEAVAFYVMDADVRLALKTNRDRLCFIVMAWDRTYTHRQVAEAWSTLQGFHSAAALHVRGFARAADKAQPFPPPPTNAACERAFHHIVAALGMQADDPSELAGRFERFSHALRNTTPDGRAVLKGAGSDHASRKPSSTEATTDALPLGVPSLEVTLSRLESVIYYALKADTRLAFTTHRERLREVVAIWDRGYTSSRIGRAWSRLRDWHTAGALRIQAFVEASDRLRPFPAAPEQAACEDAFENIVTALGWSGKDPRELALRRRRFLSVLLNGRADGRTAPLEPEERTS